MESDIQSMNKPTDQSSQTRYAVCAECGHRIKASAERLRVGDCSFICDQCYKHLSFPENVIRCCE
ncbi:MAG: hypothetical protein AMJ54_00205 [Deltaproteobacteria bacterium SG8_13]|nr:MAG: hypothetical protein AMJ54_00205 [Deltaproteobacteria bacterium SG8_13]